MAQPPNPFHVKLSVDTLAAKSQEMAEEMIQPPRLKAFITSWKWGTLVALPESVNHPEYIYEGILVHTGLSWTQRAL